MSNFLNVLGYPYIRGMAVMDVMAFPQGGATGGPRRSKAVSVRFRLDMLGAGRFRVATQRIPMAGVARGRLFFHDSESPEPGLMAALFRVIETTPPVDEIEGCLHCAVAATLFIRADGSNQLPNIAMSRLLLSGRDWPDIRAQFTETRGWLGQVCPRFPGV